MFREEVFPLVSDVDALAETFVQKPTKIPLSLPLVPSRTYIVREMPNYVPIIAIVGILSFFGFLAFLAFMRRETPPPARVRGEKPWP